MPPPAWAGTLLLVLVAVSFAGNSAGAAIAYADGSNPLTVLAFRTGVALVSLSVVLRLRGVAIRLPFGLRWRALGLGILLGIYSFGLMTSIALIPLALGIITFYTHPLWLAMASWALGLERFSVRVGLALLVAFVGLVLALEVTGDGFRLDGVAYGLLAAFSFTVLLLLSVHVRHHGDSRPVTVHMLMTGLVGFVAVAVGLGEVALPATAPGWAGMVACSAFYSFSISMLFVGVSLVGPVRAALLMYVEPVASTVLGYLILDQALAPLQLVGIALVMGALIGARRA